MAWKRSSVRSRPGPPTSSDQDAFHLHSAEPELRQVLHWLCGIATPSPRGTPAWANNLNSGTRSLDLGVSGVIRHAFPSSATRAPAEELEVASFNPRTDRERRRARPA